MFPNLPRSSAAAGAGGARYRPFLHSIAAPARSSARSGGDAVPIDIVKTVDSSLANSGVSIVLRDLDELVKRLPALVESERLDDILLHLLVLQAVIDLDQMLGPFFTFDAPQRADRAVAKLLVFFVFRDRDQLGNSFAVIAVAPQHIANDLAFDFRVADRIIKLNQAVDRRIAPHPVDSLQRLVSDRRIGVALDNIRQYVEQFAFWDDRGFAPIVLFPSTGRYAPVVLFPTGNYHSSRSWIAVSGNCGSGSRHRNRLCHRRFLTHIQCFNRI